MYTPHVSLSHSPPNRRSEPGPVEITTVAFPAPPLFSPSSFRFDDDLRGFHWRRDRRAKVPDLALGDVLALRR